MASKNTTPTNSRRKNSAKSKEVESKSLEAKEAKIVETAEAPKEKTPDVVTEKPVVRQKRKEIDRNELIACRSTTNGRLIYRSPRSNEKFTWSEFGSVEYIEMGELLTMKSSYPKFLNDVQLVIDDEEAAEYLGLNKIYDEMLQVDDLDSLFDKTNDELAVILPKLPNGLKKAVSSRARALVEEDALDSISKIKLIEQELGVDLQLFIKKD